VHFFWFPMLVVRQTADSFHKFPIYFKFFFELRVNALQEQNRKKKSQQFGMRGHAGKSETPWL